MTTDEERERMDAVVPRALRRPQPALEPHPSRVRVVKARVMERIAQMRRQRSGSPSTEG